MISKQNYFLKGALFSLLLLCVSIWLLFQGFKSSNENRLFEKEGVLAQGVILQKIEKHDTGGVYTLEYGFNANGMSIRGRDDVGANDFEKAAIGQSVQVTFLNSNPEMSKTAFSNQRQTGFYFVFGGVSAVCSIVFFAINFYKSSQTNLPAIAATSPKEKTRMQLFSAGMAILVVVVFPMWREGDRIAKENEALKEDVVQISGSIAGKREEFRFGSKHIVSYRFPLDNSTVSGEDEVDVRDYNRLSAGQPITALYSRKDPGISKTEFSTGRNATPQKLLAIIGLIASSILMIVPLVQSILYKQR